MKKCVLIIFLAILFTGCKEYRYALAIPKDSPLTVVSDGTQLYFWYLKDGALRQATDIYAKSTKLFYDGKENPYFIRSFSGEDELHLPSNAQLVLNPVQQKQSDSGSGMGGFFFGYLMGQSVGGR